MSVVINNSHFEMMDCGQCGITFYVPLSFYNERWNDGGNWHCPNGHRRIFVEPEVSRLTKVVAQKDKRIATLESDRLTFKMGLENREKELVKLRSSYHAENIVTNPPFKLANRFIHHALEHATRKVALLLRLNILESKARKKLFTKYPFARLYVHSERIPFQARTDSNNAIAFAWYVWDFSYKGDPIIRFL